MGPINRQSEREEREMRSYSESEMMIVSAARQLQEGGVVFVGVGLPNLAANLAKRLHAPDLEMIYEAGIYGAQPLRMPLSIGDPCLISGAVSVVSVADIFMLYLQRGLIDVGLLGGAQIDRYGNINSTVIGDYKEPRVRLPGSGGASAIALLAKKVVLISRLDRRNFPERVDFVSSPGFLGGRAQRELLPVQGRGPQAIITDKALFGFAQSTGEVELQALYPGVSMEEVKKGVGWELKLSDTITTVDEPQEEELRIIREELDPKGIYI
jgi:glutaconate CoA-transferase subunit B